MTQVLERPIDRPLTETEMAIDQHYDNYVENHIVPEDFAETAQAPEHLRTAAEQRLGSLVAGEAVTTSEALMKLPQPKLRMNTLAAVAPSPNQQTSSN